MCRSGYLIWSNWWLNFLFLRFLSWRNHMCWCSYLSGCNNMCWSGYLSWSNWWLNLLLFCYLSRCISYNSWLLYHLLSSFRIRLLSILLSPLDHMLPCSPCLLNIGRRCWRRLLIWHVFHLNNRILMFSMVSRCFLCNILYVLGIAKLLRAYWHLWYTIDLLMLFVVPSLRSFIGLSLLLLLLSGSRVNRWLRLVLRCVIIFFFLLCFIGFIFHERTTLVEVRPVICWCSDILSLVHKTWLLLSSSSFCFFLKSDSLFFLLLFGKSWPFIASWVDSAIDPIENIINQKPRWVRLHFTLRIYCWLFLC